MRKYPTIGTLFSCVDLLNESGVGFRFDSQVSISNSVSYDGELLIFIRATALHRTDLTLPEEARVHINKFIEEKPKMKLKTSCQPI